MIPDPRKVAINEHQRWLGYLQPDGLVVSPIALADSTVQIDTGSFAATQERFRNALKTDSSGRRIIEHFPYFARDFLDWKDELLSIWSVSAEIPDGLRVSTGEQGEILHPDAAYRFFKPANSAVPWMLLVRQLPPDTDLDQLPDAKKEHGWNASPSQKFERLLRATGVPIGILCNGVAVRLIYAPKGENAGTITFPVPFMTEIAGRAVVSALDLLLSHRRLITVPEALRLPALLRKSRDYQAHVSTELSGQVLEALYDLARGVQAADEKADHQLLTAAMERDPSEVYGGLTTTMLRLVFLMYAEDRGLMPAGELYQRNYSVLGLFEQLRSDHERHPDTMDNRYGAWPRLLVLFRAVHGGCRHRGMTLPARRGHLFDPDRFPFLEGRPDARAPLGESLPLVSDGTIHRVLHLLLYLSGERLSYRTLDVEQIGSVYETIMGFEVQKATGRSVALKPKKSHGAPVHLDLDALLARKPADREKFLLESADTKLPDAAAKALKSATTHDDLLAALDKRIDRRATPHPVPAGSIILQPTDERRRSGSHYTARSFTNPIVRKTLEPILDRLGRHPLPAAILDLKICDIAIGSGAFQVEVCRQLADELVSSWHFHKCLPVIPPDEDELLFARRLVAQRCLYGVDRNPMAVDLAKLSLWLATMAKDHPFTFLDHSIKCGDSLVGLTNRQIADFHWFDRERLKKELADAIATKAEKKEINRIKADLAILQTPVIGQEKLEQQIAKVAAARKRILDWTEDTEAAVLKKSDFLAAADAEAASLKTTGDLVIAAFFAGEKPKQRQQNRDEFLHRKLELQDRQNVIENLPWEVNTLKELRSGEYPIRPFHWEIEFPEVFYRENPGFDAFVGNPPYAGRTTISEGNHPNYIDWLLTTHEESNGNSDIAAHFMRKAFKNIRLDGCVGYVTTNTIAEGDTRRTGLKFIREREGVIYNAVTRLKWPGQAAVIVTTVHYSKGGSKIVRCSLDDKLVPEITSFLFHSGGDQDPVSLRSMKSKCFQGSAVVGMGFTFDDSDDSGTASPISVMHEILATSPIYAERIFPYIGGEEVNASPSHVGHRYIFDITNFTEQEARAKYPLLVELAEKKVRAPREASFRKKPSKDKQKRAELWWRFSRSAIDLYQAITGKDQVLVTNAQAAPHHAIAILKTGSVFANSLNVFDYSTLTEFSIIQSYVHELWARFFSSSMKDDLRYNPTDCFETFPFPPDWETNSALETAGREYYEYRAALMVRNDEGLTKTYNRFHDPEERSPDIHKLRALHAAMDRAVLAAYGWPDIPTACEFLLDYEEDDDAEDAPEAPGKKKRAKKKPYRYRWPDEVRDEVLAKLLALNATRHAEEVRLGTAPGMKNTQKPRGPEGLEENEESDSPDDFKLE